MLERPAREFTIRRATHNDIPAVMDVNLKSLPENYWYGFYVHMLERWGEAFLVAEVDGRVVGYAMSRVEETGDPVLLGLASELEDRGSGLLGKLISLLKEMASEWRSVGHLVSIAVLREYRGRGIGSSLLSETIRVMRNVYKVESIFLEVRVSNEVAIRLYERYGFKKVRLIKGYYKDGEDAFVMVKRLI
ncbi:MAG: ribosomal protein S18-alanine N-acetyltransferase [Desulfurococcales archaeon]|nr:ribosomal protein S18-alanine N-acetyltransferase [Desulfurococcales archaeon]